MWDVEMDAFFAFGWAMLFWCTVLGRMLCQHLPSTGHENIIADLSLLHHCWANLNYTMIPQLIPDFIMKHIGQILTSDPWEEFWDLWTDISTGLSKKHEPTLQSCGKVSVVQTRLMQRLIWGTQDVLHLPWSQWQCFICSRLPSLVEEKENSLHHC